MMVASGKYMVAIPASVYSRDGNRHTSCCTRCRGRVRPAIRRVVRTGTGIVCNLHGF